MSRKEPQVSDVESRWAEVKHNLSSSVSEESRNASIHKFILLFNQKYQQWNEEFEQEFLFRPDYSRKIVHIPILDNVTTIKISKSFEHYLSIYSDKIKEKKAFHTLTGIEFIYLVSLLLRKSENLSKFGNLSNLIFPIVNFLKLVQSSTKVFCVNIKNSDEIFEVENLFLQLITANCFQILLYLISHQGGWRNDHEKLVIGKDEKTIIEAKKDLLKNGILKLIRGFFDQLQEIHSSSGLVGSQEDFQILILHLVGALYQDFPATKSAALQYGIMEYIVDLIRWPEKINQNFDATPSNNPKLREEFRLQILALQVIREAIDRSTQNFQRFLNLGGWDKVMDLIFWTTEVFSVNPILARSRLLGSRSEQQSAQNPSTPAPSSSPSSSSSSNWSPFSKSWGSESIIPSSLRDSGESNDKSIPPEIQRNKTRELQLLFELLFLMTIEYHTALDVNSKSSINQSIVGIMVDLFNAEVRNIPHNQRVRQKLLNEYPELQVFVLEYMTDLLSKHPEAITILSQFKYCDTILFTNAYYYCGVDYKLAYLPDISIKDSERNQLFSKMRLQVLLFLEFIINIPSFDIFPICKKLLDILEYYYLNPDVAISISEIIGKIVLYSRQAREIFFKLKVLEILTKIINDQQQGESEDLSLIPKIDQARLSVLTLLVKLIDKSERFIKEALKYSALLQNVFILLREKKFQHFALNIAIILMSPPNPSKEIYTQMRPIYDIYLKHFHSGESFELISLLLLGMRKIANQYPPSKGIFRECGAFLAIISTLNNECNSDHLPRLCVEVLQTLTALMAFNGKNKQEMKTFIGYDQLGNLIVSALQKDKEGVLSSEINNILFDILVDNNFDINNRYTIQNPDVIALIFKLVLLVPIKLADEMIEKFSSIVRKSPRNQSICCDKELIYSILNIIQDLKRDIPTLTALVGLLEMLGSHSITVKELKKQFLLMKSEPGDFRPLAQSRLLKALQFMALSRGKSPMSFFDFDGNSSSLTLPLIDKWPNVHGYTICFWFRCESYPYSTSNSRKHPRLVSFLDKDGYGYELFLSSKDHVLNLSLVIANQDKVVINEFANFAFKYKRWYLLTINHSNPRNLLRMGNDSEVRLFVNGDLKDKIITRYPQFSQLVHNRIGASVDTKSLVGKTLNHFSGQLGEILFFDGNITVPQLQSLFLLYSEMTNNNSDTTRFGELESKIQLYYNCTARIDSEFLDLTPEKNREKRLHSNRAGNLHTAITKDVKDIIHCIGGIKVLLPLFAQLDQPLVPSSPDEPIDYSVNKHLLLQSLGLLGDMLTKSETNQMEMLRCQGFSVIGYLLQKSSPEHLTGESIFCLEDLANKIIAFPPLCEDLWVNLIFNWKIWIYANSNVQWELVRLLHSNALSRVEWIRKILGVQKLLDINFYYFWYENRCTGAQGVDPIYHPVTKRLIGQRPKESELPTLRKFIFDTIFLLMKDGAMESDCFAIIRAIIDTKDNRQVVDLLQFVESSLDTIPNFSDWILTLCGVNFFLILLRRDDEKVRVNSLKIIYNLNNRRREKDKDKEKEFDYSIAMKMLSDFPFEYETYQLLLTIMIGSNVDVRLRSTENIPFRNPQFLAHIFYLLPKAETQLKEEILQDIYLLLNNSPSNREKILQFYNWQNWLLLYLESVQPSESQLASHDFIFNIFKILILHTMNIEKASFKTMQQILGFLIHYSAKSTIQHDEFTRVLLTKVFTTLIAIANKGPAQRDFDIRSLSFLSNLILMISIADEYLYYTPGSKDIAIIQSGKVSHPNLNFLPTGQVTSASYHISNGQWIDFELAKLVLTTVDAFGLFSQTNINNVDQIVKEAQKGNVIRPGGLFKIVLKISLNVIEEGDKQVCLEAIGKLRNLLAVDLLNYKYASSERVLYALSSLMLTLKKTTANEMALEKSKIIAPLVKEMVRVCISDLPPASDLQNFTERSSVMQFIDGLRAPPLNLITNWAEKKRSTFTAEERSYAPLIDRYRIKANSSISQYFQREKKTELLNDKKLEEEIQMYCTKILEKEIERKTILLHKMEMDKKQIQRTWRNILRSLTNERAPWSTSNESTNHWKLDRSENYSRMKIKFKQNYNFDSHLGAAKDDMAELTPIKESEDSLKLFSGIKLLSLENEDSADVLSSNNLENILIEESESNNNNSAGIIQEKLIVSLYCELITPLKKTIGKLDISTSYLHFVENATDSLEKELKIPLEFLKEIHLRRYLHRRSAIEIFLTDRNNYFLNFKKKDRNKVYHKIIAINPPNLTYYETGSLEQVLKKSDLTRKWQMRLISNFDYLMQLNTIAGRTYNDITQYPVFPWVICDYESESIDLNDPKVYRDLSKPIGALNPKRLQGFIDRYLHFSEPDIPSFHYGSHYSTSGIVLFYLIRIEPFTTLFLKLQGGRFDHADRMFHSIPATWKNVLNNSSDVKELTPEFFYLPDFLLNDNKFYLGTTQQGEQLNNIVLPPWANQSAEEFIRINRAALESDYVSAHLHEWIDLIFGYKQRGRNAVEAYNVFYYLTYEGAIDIDSIEDESKKRATEDQIDNFGQTPAQILHKPHPPRHPLIDSHQTLFFKLSNRIQAKVTSISISNNPIVFICSPSYYFNTSFIIPQPDYEQITIVDDNRYPFLHRFHSTSSSPSPLPFLFEADNSLISANQRKRVGVTFATNLEITSAFFACSQDGKTIFSAGHWDYSVKCSWLLDQTKMSQSLVKHKDLVTCLSISTDAKFLISGSRDTTLLVWELIYNKSSLVRIEENPIHILYGHNSEVTCVTVESGLDICISGSNDGTCIIHNLRRGIYLRSLYHPNNHPISLVAVSTHGYIAYYSKKDLVIFLYNVNGDFISKIETHERLTNILISDQFLITGSLDGVTIRNLFGTNLIISKIPTTTKVTSLAISSEQTHLFVGLNDGNLLIVYTEEKILKKLY